MFKRLHGADKYEGTGIGLAICQKIVERNGGQIWVEANTGGGSTFILPVRRREKTRTMKKHRSLAGPSPRGIGRCDVRGVRPTRFVAPRPHEQPQPRDKSPERNPLRQ